MESDCRKNQRGSQHPDGWKTPLDGRVGQPFEIGIGTCGSERVENFRTGDLVSAAVRRCFKLADFFDLNALNRLFFDEPRVGFAADVYFR